MRLLYAEGFSMEDRRQWRVVIFNNLINAFQVILSAMEEQNVQFSDPSNEKYIDLLASDPEIDTNSPYPQNCLTAFQSLWADRGVQDAIDRGNEYALHDNLTL